MRLITVIAGLFVAALFTLDLSATNASTAPDAEQPAENSVKDQPQAPVPESGVDERSSLYENSTVEHHKHSIVTRAADYISEGKDIWREFFHSLYVDRTFNSSFALNVPLFTLTIPGDG